MFGDSSAQTPNDDALRTRQLEQSRVEHVLDSHKSFALVMSMVVFVAPLAIVGNLLMSWLSGRENQPSVLSVN
jgi:hypothetical protein